MFFTTGGSEAVETAWKLAKQYFKLTGKPYKTKVISRATAYHGTTQGALSITGVPNFKHVFEPLVPGSVRVPNTDFYRAPDHLADNEKEFGLWAANRIEEAILAEGADIGGRGLRRTGAERRRLDSRRPPAISTGCGRSVTPTTCCWSPMR